MLMFHYVAEFVCSASLVSVCLCRCMVCMQRLHEIAPSKRDTATTMPCLRKASPTMVRSMLTRLAFKLLQQSVMHTSKPLAFWILVFFVIIELDIHALLIWDQPLWSFSPGSSWIFDIYVMPWHATFVPAYFYTNLIMEFCPGMMLTLFHDVYSIVYMYINSYFEGPTS